MRLKAPGSPYDAKRFDPRGMVARSHVGKRWATTQEQYRGRVLSLIGAPPKASPILFTTVFMPSLRVLLAATTPAVSQIAACQIS